MYFSRWTILLFIFFFSNTPYSISQKKSTVAVAEDIFSDLAINDPSANSILKTGESPGEKIKKNIIVSGVFNKRTCYIGEPVLLNFELLSALKSKSTVLRLPSFDGFTSIFMDPDNSFPKYRKQDGLEFSVFTVKQVQLLPDREGEIEIGPILLDNKVIYKKDQKDYSYSGDVSSKPVTINVRRLPVAGRPENFTGATGNFSIRAFVKADSFAVGENNILTIEVDGSGNFYSVKTPALYWPTGFHNFEISEKEELNQKQFPVNGKKSFVIPFIAEQEGEFMIPAVELNFFDPASASYRKSFTQVIRLVVGPARTTGTKAALANGKNANRPKSNYYWIYIAFTGIIISLLIFYSIKQFQKSEIKKRRFALEKLEEEKIQKIQLEKNNAVVGAVRALDNSELNDRYVFTFKQALIDYLHHRLQIPDSLPEEIIQTIIVSDISAGQQLKELLEECDMLLYTAIPPDNAAHEKMLELLHSIIKKVDAVVFNK